MSQPDRDVGLDLDDFGNKPLPTHVLDEIAQQDPLNASPLDSNVRQGSGAPNDNKHTRPTAFLDGLRGFAAFLVFVSHHVPWFYGPEDDLLRGWGHENRHFIAQLPFFRIFFTGGNASVAVFFVLSGYVLSLSPLRMLREGNVRKCYTSLTSAVVRRPFRLFIPPAGVSFVFALCMHLPLGLAPTLVWPVPEPNILLEMVRWVRETAYMMNPFVGHGISEHWFPYDPPAWTMAVEFEGSMIVFGLLVAYSRVSVKQRFWLFMATGVVLLLAYRWAMACFMAGVILAMNDLEGYDHAIFPRQVSDLGKKVFHHVVFLVGWYLLCQPAGSREPKISLNTPGYWFLTQMTPANYYKQEYWRWWHAWGAMMLVYGVLRLPLLQHFFSTQPLRYLGKISFSLYLTHMPLIWTLSDRIYRLFGLQRQQEFTTWLDNMLLVPDIGMRGLSTRFLISLAFITPLSFAVAELGTRMLDEPSITVGRWIVAKLKIGGAGAGAGTGAGRK